MVGDMHAYNTYFSRASLFISFLFLWKRGSGHGTCSCSCSWSGFSTSKYYDALCSPFKKKNKESHGEVESFCKFNSRYVNAFVRASVSYLNLLVGTSACTCSYEKQLIF